MRGSKPQDLRVKAEERDRVVSLMVGNLLIREFITGSAELESLDPDSIIDALNRAVGKLVYYGSLRADAKKILARQIADNEVWMAEAIQKVSKSPELKGARVSEKSRLNKAILANKDEYERRKEIIARAEKVVDKLWVLQNGFEIQAKTLQSILAFRRAELESQLRGEAGEE